MYNERYSVRVGVNMTLNLCKEFKNLEDEDKFKHTRGTLEHY